MADAEQLPPARRRRTRERGQGQRVKRVNLRLSEAEHGVLEKAATRYRQTMAGYVSAAALAAARDELPADAREACIELVGMQADLARLRDAHGIDSGELSDTLFAMREAMEEAAAEFINVARRARGQRALRSFLRPRPAPAAAPQQQEAPVPRLPATAEEWRKQLAELARELEAGGQLADRHWEFGRLYGAVLDVVVALGNSYPGGIDPAEATPLTAALRPPGAHRDVTKADSRPLTNRP
ncbi:hypothetical protein OIE67_16075 [Nonomuraea fuscirosea]|uniref:hypothetical protein n=1 Tax=Nonomuraea fuscirosea TaxID=1291556 RepID=UPI002DD9CC23|nr:hypothetical protein [Nonomuraea fuscirosea]WSA56059.1 hypothetical protein OIE67_16075 [Nonomuraea fuscirosea]